MKRIQFVCEHCGAEVLRPSGSPSDRNYDWSYNSCPECDWSKHVAYADPEHPVCGGMMKPTLLDEGTRIVHRCVGCGFITTTADDAPMIIGLKGDGFPVNRWRTGHAEIDIRRPVGNSIGSKLVTL